MTTATLPRLELPLADRSGPRTLARSGGDGLTLGQALAGVWEGLSSPEGEAACPVCHGHMVSATRGSGVCTDCGTSIS